MSLPTLTPTEQKTIEMADTICGALMRPGWFESIDQNNPWADDGLLIRADEQCRVIERRATPRPEKTPRHAVEQEAGR
jgi:hypothetical protein